MRAQLRSYLAKRHAVVRGCVLLLWLSSAGALANETGYRIDPATSHALFRVRLLWLDKVNGHFTQVNGDVIPGPHANSLVVAADIAVNSVEMASAFLRQWVLAPTFFDAAHHPVIHFVSDPFALAELDRGGTLTGSLTLRGVTAPVEFAVDPSHCAPLTSAPCQITLRGHLHRSTFGMTSDHLALSDRVDLNLSITLQRESR